MAYTATTLVKGLRVLESLAKNGPQTLSELAIKLSLNTTTTFRLLYTLTELNYVKKSHNTYSLAHQTQTGFNNPNLGWVAVPIVRDIVQKYHASAFIGILRDQSVVISQVIPKNNDPAEYHVLGQASPITMSALGKCAVAFLPADKQRDFLATMTLPTGTKYTLADRQAVNQNLAVVHDQGYALDDEESSPGVRCLAVPLYLNNHQVAALGIAGSFTELQRNQLRKMAKDLMQCSQQISDEFF